MINALTTILVGVVVARAGFPGDQVRPIDPRFHAAASTYLEAQEAHNDFMGVVRVSREGRPLLRVGYGPSNVELGVAHTPEGHFRIGSISKMFAAALAHRLIEEGALSLENRLESFFDDIPESWKPITIGQLLDHRSGILDLERMENYAEAMVLPTTPRETMKRFYSVPLRFAPGTRFEYSSSGYVIIAAIAEQIEGRPYEELLREHVLDPMGLTETGHDRRAMLLPKRVSGYTWGRHGLENAAYIDMDLPTGGGELYSTVDDLDRWARTLEGGQLLKGSSLERLMTPRAVAHRGARQEIQTLFGVDVSEGGYANGWAVGEQHGRRCRQHGGIINGFAAYLARFPDDDVTVVVLNNSESYSTVLDIGVDLAAIVFGEECALPAPRPDLSRSLELLESYTGRYGLVPGLEVVVSREDSRLIVTLADGSPLPVRPVTETTFDFRAIPYKITFVANDDALVNGIELDVGGGQIMKGRRIR